MLNPAAVLNEFYDINILALSTETRFAFESQMRLLSGMWLALGIYLLCSIRQFEQHRRTFHIAFLGLSLAAVGELVVAIQFADSVQAALLKAAIQIAICVGLALWMRAYLKER